MHIMCTNIRLKSTSSPKTYRLVPGCGLDINYDTHIHTHTHTNKQTDKINITPKTFQSSVKYPTTLQSQSKPNKAQS